MTTEQNTETTDVRPHGSPAVRGFFIAAGFVSMGLGILGVFLPLLPTTVFFLIAAYCFARSSRRFYSALMGNRYAGPMIRDWQERRCIPPRSKAYAIFLVILTFALSVIFVVEHAYLRALLVAGGVVLVIYLRSLPSCTPEPPTAGRPTSDAPTAAHSREASETRQSPRPAERR